MEINDNNFIDFINTDTPVFVKVGAEWCGPCKAINPIVEELSKEYSNVKFGSMDVDSSPETTARLGIRSVPTILIYKNGMVVEKHVGSASKIQLKGFIDKHLS